MDIYEEMKAEALELIKRIDKYKSKTQDIFTSTDRSSVKRKTLDLDKLMADYRNRRYKEV